MHKVDFWARLAKHARTPQLADFRERSVGGAGRTRRPARLRSGPRRSAPCRDRAEDGNGSEPRRAGARHPAPGGFLDRAADGSYRLGDVLVVLGRRTEARDRLDTSEARLKQLTARTGESSSLAVRAGADAWCSCSPHHRSGCASSTGWAVAWRCTPRQWAKRSSRSVTTSRRRDCTARCARAVHESHDHDDPGARRRAPGHPRARLGGESRGTVRRSGRGRGARDRCRPRGRRRHRRARPRGAAAQPRRTVVDPLVVRTAQRVAECLASSAALRSLR